jgi:16S rRNA C967 or C1407 C5-methylase (RsmB/RsmF family)
MVIQAFMQANPGFDLVEAKPRLGLTGLMGQTGAQRLYPHLHRCNGFYIARLEKASD